MFCCEALAATVDADAPDPDDVHAVHALPPELQLPVKRLFAPASHLGEFPKLRPLKRTYGACSPIDQKESSCRQLCKRPTGMQWSTAMWRAVVQLTTGLGSAYVARRRAAAATTAGMPIDLGEGSTDAVDGERCLWGFAGLARWG